MKLVPTPLGPVLLRLLQTLADSLADAPGRALELPITLCVPSSRTEAQAHPGRECASLKQKDGEDDTETGAESGLDDEVGEALVPLRTVRIEALSCEPREQPTLLLRSSSEGFGERLTTLGTEEVMARAGAAMAQSDVLSAN